MKNIVNTYMTAQNIAEYTGNKAKQQIVPQESSSTTKISIEDKVELSANLQKFKPWDDKYQGSWHFTGNDMDFAIGDSGFLRVIGNDDRVYYSRDGRLGVDEQGFLIQRESGAMLYPPLNITNYTGLPPEPTWFSPELFISRKGELSVVHAGYYKDIYEVGKIYLYDFANVDGLENMGNNLFRATKESGMALDKKMSQNSYDWCHQGFLEDLSKYENIGKVV